MSKAESNTTKGLRGSNGNQTYRKLCGQTIVSQRIEENTTNTPKQSKQRALMKCKGKLSSSMLVAIRNGFLHRKRLHTAANAFVQINDEAVTAEATEKPLEWTVTTDFTKIICASGNLTLPNITATYDAETKNIVFNVLAPYAGSLMQPDDMVYVAIYETKKNLCLCPELGPRSEVKTYTFQLPEGWNRDNLAIYSFVGNKRTKRNSQSIYLELA